MRIDAGNLEVTMTRVEELVPYARNAKRHTAEQIEQIANSIEEFGFADPVGVWKSADGRLEIVEGHGRVLAAQELGIEEVPVIHLDALTDTQRRAYMLAHNQLTMNTGWDWAALDLEIGELSESLDMGDFGFEGLAKKDDLLDLFLPYESAAGNSGTEQRNREFTCPHCGKAFAI